MPSSKVYIVTGVNNNWSHTDKFLRCVNIQTYKNIEVIVIDDGSVDDTFNNITKFYPHVNIIKGDGSLWWTGCMHVAFKKVLFSAKKEDYILTVNNDCTFDKNYVKNILSAAADNPNSVIGSIALDKRDKMSIIDSGAKIDWQRGRVYGAGYHRLNRVPKDFIYDSEINALSTRGTLFPLPIVKKVGNFDKKHLPHYVSDFEYTIRIRNSGFGLTVAYNCIVVNDTKRTGSTGPINHPISTSEYLKMLFSRKSQINIIDHFYFIFLCCPWYLQPINYLYLFGKLLYVTSFLKLFFLFRKPIVKFHDLLILSDQLHEKNK